MSWSFLFLFFLNYEHTLRNMIFNTYASFVVAFLGSFQHPKNSICWSTSTPNSLAGKTSHHKKHRTTEKYITCTAQHSTALRNTTQCSQHYTAYVSHSHATHSLYLSKYNQSYSVVSLSFAPCLCAILI